MNSSPSARIAPPAPFFQAEADQNTPAAGELYQTLLDLIRPLNRVIVAFSGGVDSALVLKAAYDALGRENALAVTAVSPSLARRELKGAEKTAQEIGAPHRIIETREMENPSYSRNEPDRCYHCKTELYSVLSRLRKEENYPFVLNGANSDDRGDHRPGMKAALENGVRSPLLEANLGKKEIRAIARELGLSVHEKPASPCLSSRIPYYRNVTLKKLRQIEEAENFLRDRGFREFRVRHHDEIARIELSFSEFAGMGAAETRAAVNEEFRRLGFEYAVLDLAEFQSGRLNRVLGD